MLEFNELVPARAEVPRAILLDGERRGPLQNSGGVYGYTEKLAALSDSTHPNHAEIASWVDWVTGPWRSFRPEEVAFDAINAELRAVFPAALDRPTRSTTLDQVVLAEIPDGIRRDFRAYLATAVSSGPHLVDDETAEAMVRPYLWLIRRIGLEGVTLSAAGWMPSQIVSDAVRDLDWRWRWYGVMNRESQTLPVLQLRETATQFGLVRKLKGRLVLSVAARACLDDPQALWRVLAQGIANSRGGEVTRDALSLLAVEVAAGRTVEFDRNGNSESQPIPYGLGILGWRGGDGWGPITTAETHGILFDAVQAFDFMDAFVRAAKHSDGLVGVTDGGRAFARAILQSVVK